MLFLPLLLLFLLLNYVTTNLWINRIFNNISSGNQSDGKDFYLRRSRRRLHCLGSVPCITLFHFTFLIANQSVPAEIPILYCILPYYYFFLHSFLLYSFLSYRLSLFYYYMHVYCSFCTLHLYLYYAWFNSQCGGKTISFARFYNE